MPRLRGPRSDPAPNQPVPVTPDVTRQMVRDHARRLFRDKWAKQQLSAREWRLAEADLVRRLEAEAF